MLARRMRDIFRSSGLVVWLGSRIRSPWQVWGRRALHANVVGFDLHNSSMVVTRGGLRTNCHVKACRGVSHFSSSAGLHRAENSASQSVKRLPVQVGASLKIDVSGSAAGVNVTVGDNLEEVLIQPKWVKFDEWGQGWKLVDIMFSDSRVDVTHSDVVQSQGVQLPLALVEMNAQMPARWCGLNVAAGLGSVYIQNVRESDLSVRTSGGNVKLGEMKGSEASINSGGGDVEANVVQAKSSIQTCGGKIWLKRIQGTSITLDSDGGNILLGSLYGDEVIVKSRGGSVEAKEIQAKDRAFVSSGGGSIIINGIDGKVAVASQGGNVELQLNEHAEDVTVDAGNGGIVLCLSARLTAQLKYDGSEGVVQEGSILTAGPDFGIFEFTGTESASNKQGTNSGWRGSESYLPGGVTACKIHVSSAGQVHVKQRSWFDLVTSSFP